MSMRDITHAQWSFYAAMTYIYPMAKEQKTGNIKRILVPFWKYIQWKKGT